MPSTADTIGSRTRAPTAPATGNAPPRARVAMRVRRPPPALDRDTVASAAAPTKSSSISGDATASAVGSGDAMRRVPSSRGVAPSYGGWAMAGRTARRCTATPPRTARPSAPGTRRRSPIGAAPKAAEVAPYVVSTRACGIDASRAAAVRDAIDSPGCAASMDVSWTASADAAVTSAAAPGAARRDVAPSGLTSGAAAGAGSRPGCVRRWSGDRGAAPGIEGRGARDVGEAGGGIGVSAFARSSWASCARTASDTAVEGFRGSMTPSASCRATCGANVSGAAAASSGAACAGVLRCGGLAARCALVRADVRRGAAMRCAGCAARGAFRRPGAGIRCAGDGADGRGPRGIDCTPRPPPGSKPPKGLGRIVPPESRPKVSTRTGPTARVRPRKEWRRSRPRPTAPGARWPRGV